MFYTVECFDMECYDRTYFHPYYFLMILKFHHCCLKCKSPATSQQLMLHALDNLF